MANTLPAENAGISQAGKAAPEPAPPHCADAARWGDYRTLWPLATLLVAEALAATLTAQAPGLRVSPPLLAFAGAVLLAGLLPALLRPSAVSNLVGCFAVALASVFWRVPSALVEAPRFDNFAAALASGGLTLYIANAALLAPLTLHLSARFPQRGDLSGRTLALFYAVVAACALALFAAPPAAHMGALAALTLTVYAGFALAGRQFLRTIRRAQPLHPRAAQQARLLLMSLALAEGPFLLLPFGNLIRLYIPYEIVLGAQIILPIGVAYAILRNDLLGIDAVLRRALDYAAVSFGLLVIYFGLATLLTRLTGALGGTWGSVATILSVMAAAAAFTPLRRVSQRTIDRAFYPERLAFRQAMGAAQTSLARVAQREAVVNLFERELPQQLGGTWARLVLRPSFEQPAEAARPGVWSALLLVGGQPLGCYWLGPRRSGLPYAADEQEQLRGLVQQAALALAYDHAFDTLQQLNRELEERVATRTEHVLAQQRELAALEERQRLARDLHDSVKQTLFSLGLGLRAVRGRLRSDPDAAESLLRQQEQAALQAQAEMGELLAQLRTPAGQSADLAAMLAQHSEWLAQQHGLRVALHAPPSLALPQPLARELAQIAREALHNVLRHSGASEARLSLDACEGRHLTLSVEDQGRGFDAAESRSGHGLRGMAERAAALGGRMELQTAPGEGTRVWIQVELPNHPD